MQPLKIEAFRSAELDSITSRVAQLYRECNNMIPYFSNQLQALSSMTRQKEILQASFRRHQFLQSNSKNSRLSIPPLGVLNHFMPSVTEQLIAQHTTDQASLVAALFSSKKKWSDNVRKVNEQIERVEEGILSTVSSCCFSGWSSNTNRSNDGGCNSSSTTSKGQDCAYSDKSDSPSSSAHISTTAFGLHGIAAVMVKMESTLQEIILALRKDYQRIYGGGHHFADNLSFLLHAATEKYSGALIPPLPWHENESKPPDPFVSSSGEITHERIEEDEEEEESAIFFCDIEASPMKRFSFAEALEQLESFVWSRWKTYCSSFLHDQSLLLLSC